MGIPTSKHPETKKPLNFRGLHWEKKYRRWESNPYFDPSYPTKSHIVHKPLFNNKNNHSQLYRTTLNASIVLAQIQSCHPSIAKNPPPENLFQNGIAPFVLPTLMAQPSSCIEPPITQPTEKLSMPPETSRTRNAHWPMPTTALIRKSSLSSPKRASWR